MANTDHQQNSEPPADLGEWFDLRSFLERGRDSRTNKPRRGRRARRIPNESRAHAAGRSSQLERKKSREP